MLRGADIYIVRFLPIILFIISGVDIILCWHGYDLSNAYLLHSNSIIYASALFLISLSNSKYHCIYNRLCYAYLIIMPIINYADSRFDLIPNVESYLIFFSVLYGLMTIGTIILSIYHFISIKLRHYGKRR